MIKSTQSTLEKEYWEKIKREETITAIGKCEEAAKQLITINSLLSTIYVGIISFSEVTKQALSVRWSMLLWFFPLPFWLVSLILATRVVVPFTHSSSTQIQDDYVQIAYTKYNFLRRSYFVLIVSIFVLMAVVLIYVLFVPPPPP